MSNTIVTNYSNASGKTSNPDKSLVILVNKDGSVLLEKDTIQSLMGNQCDNTTVSIVRMNEDGKPDDASDHSSDETVPHINVTVDAFFDSYANEDGKEPHNDYVSDLFGSEIPLLGFQNDHCYTPLTSPSQSRRNSDCDPIVYKDDIAPKSYIPSSKKITVLENKIIAKGKNVQYYTSGAREILKGSDLLKRPITSQNLQLVRKIDVNRHQLKSVDNENLINKRLSDINKHESIENEQNSTINHDTLILNQDGSIQTIKKSLLKKDVKKILSKKIELKNNGLANSSVLLETDQTVGVRNKKITKSYSTHKIIDEKGKSYIIKNELLKGNSDGVKQTLVLNTKSINNAEISKESLKSDNKLDIHKIQQKSVLKKDKKTPHMTALINDINSLFSSPDVIRRVSTDSKTPKTPDRVPGSLLKKVDHSTSFSMSNVDKIGGDMSDSKISSSKTDLKSHQNISTTSKSVRSISDMSTRRPKNQKEGLDLMSPFDEVSLAQLLDPTNTEILSPVNIPLDIGPVTVQTQMLDKHDAANSNTSALMSPNSLNATGLNGPLSPNLDLLGGLHPEEEGLPEDLLRHVAQLVESSENLQEVIDKEVLGKVNIHSKDTIVKQISHPAPMPLTKIEQVPHQALPDAEKPQSISNLIRKEPIQIVRSNGRIITLPPIEAPATRSSKRKSLMNSAEINPGISNPDLSKVSPAALTPAKPINTYSRSHKASESKSVVQTPTEKKNDDDAESDESWNSEDDPDRLWCICKQPHNNRFMICCDSCEDWFHGKCVNVTKAMGQEMEERGIEWRCPSCVKKKGLANPSLKSLTSLRKSTEVRIDERASRLSSDSGNLLDSNTNCIVCKRPARASSIYCSDACILKHAQESLTLTSPTIASAKNVRDNTLNKPKPETRVIVFERKTGKLLAGSNAPTTNNLKTWLQEHPTYEVVQPGTNTNRSPNIVKIKSKPNTPKFQSVLTIGQDKQISFVSPAMKSPPAPVKQVPKTPSQTSPSNLKSPTSLNRPQVPKIVVKTPPPLKVQTPPQKPTPLKSPVASTSQKKEESTPQRFSYSSEPIRENVKKTLCEEISKRMAESKDVKFTQEEILKFSADTEYELHDLFKDVGAKYKVKYRSLMFNLKDRKNLTLWQKICDRSITPKQLVRLSPEELASQELAQWRDKEAKHQLELIKKSELDLLACNKTYVLKTHKGEEVMESRTTDTAELDPNVSVEDLVSALNKSTDGVDNLGGNENKLSSPTSSSREKSHSSHHKHSRHKSKSSKSSKSSSSKRDHSSSRHDSSSSKHRSSKDSRSGSRSHHRKTSRDRNRKRSSSRRHSESTRHLTHSKSSKHDDKKRSSENRRSSSSSKDDRHSKDSDSKKNINEFTMDIIGLENIRSPVIYDTKGDDELGNDVLSPNSDSLKSPPTPEMGVVNKIIGNTESDQEPSSTMDSKIWSGIINMADVATFSVIAHEVSGQCDDIPKLQPTLEVVGRISPDTVWDYISKMRKQGYNDISVLRFVAVDEEKNKYMTLYNYLSTRSRLGVIRANIGVIKDFYLLPLASHAPLPSVLLPLQGPGFEDSKPNLLLGIIVKQRRKRVSHFSTFSSIPSKISKLGHLSDRSYTPPNDSSYTPPSSPKRKAISSGMPLPSFLPNLSSTTRDKIATSLTSGDDEPYSPGGSDSGSLERSNSPAVKQSKASDALHKKMEELTRKIEEEKKQIENIAVTISGDSLDEPYSPSRPMSPSSAENPLTGLSSISLPSNLQEILASIQKKTKGPNNDVNDSMEPYIPQSVNPPSTNPYYKESFSGDVDMRMTNPSSFQPPITNFTQNQVETSQKSTSKLSTLSEAELLSMVPDDEVLLPTNKMNTVYPPLPHIPPPSLVTNTSIPPPPYKRQKIEYGQPPPPGFEDL